MSDCPTIKNCRHCGFLGLMQKTIACRVKEYCHSITVTPRHIIHKGHFNWALSIKSPQPRQVPEMLRWVFLPLVRSVRYNLVQQLRDMEFNVRFPSVKESTRRDCLKKKSVNDVSIWLWSDHSLVSCVQTGGFVFVNLIHSFWHSQKYRRCCWRLLPWSSPRKCQPRLTTKGYSLLNKGWSKFHIFRTFCVRLYCSKQLKHCMAGTGTSLQLWKCTMLLYKG